VPGSRKDAIVGALGDRLKVKVAAAPEEGKANAAVCGLIAARLGLKTRDVTVVVGHASAEKTLRIEGLTAAEAEGRLGRGYPKTAHPVVGRARIALHGDATDR
jgi:uncharacterized protein (TIGR00251 family)